MTEFQFYTQLGTGAKGKKKPRYEPTDKKDNSKPSSRLGTGKQ